MTHAYWEFLVHVEKLQATIPKHEGGSDGYPEACRPRIVTHAGSFSVARVRPRTSKGITDLLSLSLVRLFSSAACPSKKSLSSWEPAVALVTYRDPTGDGRERSALHRGARRPANVRRRGVAPTTAHADRPPGRGWRGHARRPPFTTGERVRGYRAGPTISRTKSRSLSELTRQIAPPTKNGHAPPPTESRKSSQSVNLSGVRACSSRDDPRISPLTSRYECPRPSLLIITSGPENRPGGTRARINPRGPAARARKHPEGRFRAPAKGGDARDRGLVPLFHATINVSARRRHSVKSTAQQDWSRRPPSAAPDDRHDAWSDGTYEDPGRVSACRQYVRPTCRHRSDYELFNRNNFNIRYWSWNYRGCWHQTCPPIDPRLKVLKCSHSDYGASDESRIVIFRHYLPVPGVGNLRACCLPWMWINQGTRCDTRRARETRARALSVRAKVRPPRRTDRRRGGGRERGAAVDAARNATDRGLSRVYCDTESLPSSRFAKPPVISVNPVITGKPGPTRKPRTPRTDPRTPAAITIVFEHDSEMSVRSRVVDRRTEKRRLRPVRALPPYASTVTAVGKQPSAARLPLRAPRDCRYARRAIAATRRASAATHLSTAALSGKRYKKKITQHGRPADRPCYATIKKK
ncbi:Hypothetical protein CINCED_3A024611 [Cinara cedri]|uniref:Uncharacterized protein n=1 Tax=Cinara cedri TaxID=506608 RepID=A0A5E4NGN7_9HEMI|nr:Hypothetical protein CINCED_3A024611 [Cinara cedri]